MEETFSTVAIILSREPFRENDSLVSIYSPDIGKASLVARGTGSFRSKLAGHIEPIILARIMVVRGRKMDYVGASVGENYFAGLKKDYSCLALAGKIINIFKILSKEEDESRFGLFFLLNDYLSFIDSRKSLPTASGIIYYSFVLKMLDLSGFKPELEKCLGCGVDNKDLLRKFDYGSGGLVCAKCGKSRQQTVGLSEHGVEIMKASLKENINFLSNIKINLKTQKECEAAVEAFFRYNFSY